MPGGTPGILETLEKNWSLKGRKKTFWKNTFYGLPKKISPFSPAVWQAIANISIYIQIYLKNQLQIKTF